MYTTIWLVNRSLYFYVNSSQREFSNRKTVVSGKKSVMSKKITVQEHLVGEFALAHLTFCSCISPTYTFHFTVIAPAQRFRFGSLPTSSQERVKQESTIMFTFTMHLIYEVNGQLNISKNVPHSLSHTHTLSNSLCLLQGLQSFDPSNHRSIDQYIDRSINPSVNPSIDQSINPSIHRFIDHLIDPSIHPSIHWSIHPSIHRSFNGSTHWSIYPSIDQSIDPIDQCIDRSIHPSINSGQSHDSFLLDFSIL